MGRVATIMKSNMNNRKPFGRHANTRQPAEEKGVVLVAVVIFTLVFTILGFSALIVAGSEVMLTRKDVNKIKAFYLAEAGIGKLTASLSSGGDGSIEETALGGGSYHVDYYPGANPPYAISTGAAGGYERRIKVTLLFLIPSYECGMYANNVGGTNWTLMLRGTGSPQPSGPLGEEGGKDIINGNIFVKGDVDMYEESRVDPAPLPNTYELEGDVEATGSVNLHDSSFVSGQTTENAEVPETPDLIGMNYAVNHTHNIAQIFAEEEVSGGHLVDHELRDVFMMNPPDRSAECSGTVGDDYFLEPVSISGGGSWKEAKTPLHLGNGRIYYVDGDVWVHTQSSYGFLIDGTATIVATGDIHLSDNLLYADSNSMLGLVALGKYDGDGDRVSGGNIYFGDPRYGTMYVVSAMMFAAHDFLFNTDSVSHEPTEPKSGFVVNGNLAALNMISIERDWYTTNQGEGREERPARYDPSTGQWVDSLTGTVLTETQVGTLRHYQMIINYDERVRNQRTQPNGLPRGGLVVFCGITSWEELP